MFLVDLLAKRELIAYAVVVGHSLAGSCGEIVLAIDCLGRDILVECEVLSLRTLGFARVEDSLEGVHCKNLRGLSLLIRISFDSSSFALLM